MVVIGVVGIVLDKAPARLGRLKMTAAAGIAGLCKELAKAIANGADIIASTKALVPPAQHNALATDIKLAQAAAAGVIPEQTQMVMV